MTKRVRNTHSAHTAWPGWMPGDGVLYASLPAHSPAVGRRRLCMAPWRAAPSAALVGFQVMSPGSVQEQLAEITRLLHSQGQELKTLRAENELLRSHLEHGLKPLALRPPKREQVC